MKNGKRLFAIALFVSALAIFAPVKAQKVDTLRIDPRIALNYRAIIADLLAPYLAEGRVPEEGQMFWLSDSLDIYVTFIGSIPEFPVKVGELQPNQVTDLKDHYDNMWRVVGDGGEIYIVGNDDWIQWRSKDALYSSSLTKPQGLANIRAVAVKHRLMLPIEEGGASLPSYVVTAEGQPNDHECAYGAQNKEDCLKVPRTTYIWGFVGPSVDDLKNLILAEFNTALTSLENRLTDAITKAEGRMEKEIAKAVTTSEARMNRTLGNHEERITFLEKVVKLLEGFIPEDVALAGGVHGSNESGAMTSYGLLVTSQFGEVHFGGARGFDTRNRIVPVRGPAPMWGRPWSGFFRVSFYPLKLGENTAIMGGFEIEPWTTDLSRPGYGEDHEEDVTRLAFPLGIRHRFLLGDGRYITLSAQAGYSIFEHHQKNVDIYSGPEPEVIPTPAEMDHYVNGLEKHDLTERELFWKVTAAISLF